MKSAVTKKTYEPPAVHKLTASHAKGILLNHAKEFFELIFPGRIAKRDSDAAMVPTCKQYQKPALKKLTPEQAKLLLIGMPPWEINGREIFWNCCPPRCDSRREGT